MGPKMKSRIKRTKSQYSASATSVSQQSTNSQGSVVSIGMGATAPPKRCLDECPRIMPEGAAPSNQLVYDCIVYLFYCNAHDMIAITTTNNRILWLPFVALPENVGWEQATQDGIAMLIGKKSEELDSKLASGLPKYTVTTLQVLRVQISTDKFLVRLAQHVSLTPTSGYKCCQNNPRLQWVPFADVMQDKLANYWGPEVKLFTGIFYKMLQNEGQREKRMVIEFGLDNAMDVIMNPEKVGTADYILLTENKVCGEPSMTLYQDFFEHCFPAFHMSLEAFKAYLIRYGFPKNDERFPWLFHAFEESRDGYVSFNEFLVGIVCMEPTTTNCESRSKFIFRYFDCDNDDHLNENEFSAFVSTLQTDGNDNKSHRKNLEAYLTALGCKTTRKVPLPVFVEAITSGKIQGTEFLLRSPKLIIPQARELILRRIDKEQKNATSSDTLTYNVKRKDRGTCNGCKVQNYEYGLHCVFFDTFGRSVKPLRIRDYHFNDDGETPMTAQRYSAEFTFGIGSICNMFIDIIRNYYQKNEKNALLSSTEERQMIHKYTTTLCENVSELVGAEERLVKINAPATIVGDILGNIDAVFSMERTLWQGIPIIASNYVFLGNYTAASSTHNVDVIIYLFALKMLSPNQIILLKGMNEIRESSNDILLVECKKKYGTDIGLKLFDLFNNVFDRMPLAVVVDESIFCVHSGVPKTSARLAKFYEIPEVLKKVASDSPLAYELIMNVPTEVIANPEQPTNIPSSLMEFNPAIFSSFLKVNELEWMIRSHDVNKEGYKLFFDGRCITISSTYAYQSKIMVCMIDSADETIRLVNVDVEGLRNAALINATYT